MVRLKNLDWQKSFGTCRWTRHSKTICAYHKVASSRLFGLVSSTPKHFQNVYEGRI